MSLPLVVCETRCLRAIIAMFFLPHVLLLIFLRNRRPPPAVAFHFLLSQNLQGQVGALELYLTRHRLGSFPNRDRLGGPIGSPTISRTVSDREKMKRS